MLYTMGAVEQRQYPRLGLGLPVTLLFSERGQTFAGELQDISHGGCFFKSTASIEVNRRISVVFSVSSGGTCKASGRVVRTVAYRGFAVLFDDDGAISDFIRDMTPLSQERRVAYLRDVLKPEIEIL